jgi:hypothetical protein
MYVYIRWIQLALCGAVPSSCEHEEERSDTIKGEEFLQQLSDCHLPKKTRISKKN